MEISRTINGLLERHVSGALPMPLDVLARAHLELNPINRSYVRDLEGLAAENALHASWSAPGGPVSDASTSTAALDADAMLARVFETVPDTASRKAVSPAREPWMPQAISDVLGSEGVNWRGKMPGFKEMHLGTVEDCEMSLFWIKAGRAIPMHTHEGSELTLVLDGGFSDGEGHYVRGDISIADHNVDHRPVADDDGPCIGFAVTTDNLRLTGPIHSRILDILGRG
ncbi:MAG: ChrR family anti-sigma-E factor [Pseudomonadota bacterium]